MGDVWQTIGTPTTHAAQFFRGRYKVADAEDIWEIGCRRRLIESVNGIPREEVEI